jgi:rubrerythrin
MNISETLKTLKAQLSFERTSKGRSITEKGLHAVKATLDDEKNHNIKAAKCLNCGIIASSLLMPKGCPNCGAIDITTDVNEGDVL